MDTKIPEWYKYLKPNSMVDIEELSELLFGLIITGAPELKPLKAEWSQIIERITHVSKMKAKSAPSISNKTIFKHMDMLMELERQLNLMDCRVSAGI